jgi:biopolymer transport protein ExbB
MNNTLRHILSTALALCCVSASVAQTATAATAPSDAINRVGQSAQAQLAKSISELNALRETVTNEKLPLAQELTTLEGDVTRLRKDVDRTTRLVDVGALEIATIKNEMKARQEELAYVGNLLDEYARTFETKINPCEMQYCGDLITAAKDAAENKTLSAAERFSRQTSFVDSSIKRVVDSIGGMRFPGSAVDMLGTVSEGQFALIGPIALFRASTGAAGFATAQAGSSQPLVRGIEGELQNGIGTLVTSGEGTLPLDPSRGGALKALVQKTNLIHIFVKGGPIMWPLLAASVLALAVVLERVLFLLLEARRRSPKTVDRFFREVEAGDLAAAVATSKGSKDCVVKTLGYALEHRELSFGNALAYAQSRALKRFSRGISILDTVITLAPLLGLLGTVTGMMASFAVIGGDLSSPGAITGGIAEALIATAFGLGIAITALLPFNFLNTKIEEVENDITTASAQLRLLVEPDSLSRADAKAKISIGATLTAPTGGV